MTLDLKHFKNKLEKEKATLNKELSHVAINNPENPGDWEPKPSERDTSQADDNIVADGIEEYKDNAAITGTLEARLKDVQSGLDNIEKNTYGICKVCGEEIELDRLEANPAAQTCKAHINERL